MPEHSQAHGSTGHLIPEMVVKYRFLIHRFTDHSNYKLIKNHVNNPSHVIMTTSRTLRTEILENNPLINDSLWVNIGSRTGYASRTGERPWTRTSVYIDPQDQTTTERVTTTSVKWRRGTGDEFDKDVKCRNADAVVMLY